jgi:hypothetical protein
VPVLLSAADNVARFDHNPITGESLGLLIEEQRTNLQIRSQDFSTGWTLSASTVIANTIIAPDGTLSGAKLFMNSGQTIASNRSVFQNISGVTGVHTASIYAKAGEFSTLRISILSAASTTLAGPDFNLSAGTVGSLGSATRATITPVGNGWYRCEATFDFLTGATAARVYYASTQATGNGFDGLYIWGAQLEAGAFPTSYIPTVASQVTRSADAASMTGANFSSWYRADEGTLYAESTLSGNAINKDLVFISDNTSSNSMAIRWASGAQAQFSVTVGGASQSNIAPSGFSTVGVSYKRAAAYQVNNFEQAINGASVGTDTSGTVPIVDRLYFGSTSGGVNLCGTVKKLAFYPKRLANAELQALTQI